MKKSIFLSHLTILLVLISNVYLKAQNKPLTVGDQLPDFTFRNVFNGASPEMKLSDFRGKLVILDFWGVNCIPCVEEFPALDSLQKAFGAEIQIITVNPLGLDSIKRFFSRHPKIYLPYLPFITGDTVLQQIFPHWGNPYLIWIGKDGKVLLNDVPIKREYIEAVLTGKPVRFPEAIKKNYTETLFDKRWSGDVLYSSYLYKGVDLGVRLEKSENGQSFSEGGTISFLYQRAWEGFTNEKYGLFRPGRTVIETKDSSKYIEPKNLSDYDFQVWLKSNFYWYQCTVPKGKPYGLYSLMKEDLDRAFHLNAGIEKRPVRCLVLVRTSNKDKIRTKGRKPVDTFFRGGELGEDYGLTRVLINQPFSKLSKRLTGLIEYGLKRPFVDQTGYSGNIDVRFKADRLDQFTLAKLRNALSDYDLDLVERDIGLDVLVLKEN